MSKAIEQYIAENWVYIFIAFMYLFTILGFCEAIIKTWYYVKRKRREKRKQKMKSQRKATKTKKEISVEKAKQVGIQVEYLTDQMLYERDLL